VQQLPTLIGTETDIQTMHFKLLNALCRHRAAESKEKAFELHCELLSSGMDRILVVSNFSIAG
jgi:hypothetical protein